MYFKKKYLNKLSRKRSGSIKIEGALYLDRNERPVPFSRKIMHDLTHLIKNLHLNFYPEIDKFYNLIARWKRIDVDNLYITEGVSGAIKSIIENFAVPGKSNIIFPSPTFALYEVFAKMFNLKSKKINYLNYKLNVKKIYSVADKNTAIIFIPNPNLPIEGFQKLDEIKKLASFCLKKKILLVIDEVYFPFSTVSCISLIKKYNNIMIMQSFSKAFGLAGIRLGYMIGSKENISYISKTRTGYESNSLSIAVASYFIKNQSITKNYIKDVKEGMKFLRKGLKEMKLDYSGGLNSNYIYVNLGCQKITKTVTRDLRKLKIFVRDGWEKPFNTGFLVSGGPKNEMITFFTAFKKIYENIKR
mgnify:CR=1 FL=1